MEKVSKPDAYDLKVAWQNACDAFATTSGEKLNVKTQYTPDEVLEQIRKKHEKDEEKAAKYRVVKDVLSKTLDCIDNLGNIAAQGASMVFGPAGFAGNALSYLIATGAKYKYIFNSLAELFTKISNFLERFKIYFRMPDVDISLRVVINELLISFVSICGLSIKVLKGNKALLYLKVFAFSDDAGVSAKMQELADLVEKEREMRATLGYEVEKKIEESVATGRLEAKEGFRGVNSTLNDLAEKDKKREARSLQSKQVEAVAKALDKPNDNYKTIYQNLIDRRVEGTGDWVSRASKYAAWRQPEPATSSILCLAGGEGYGKSFLTSTIIQDLKKRFPPAEVDASRTSVAYYYFQKEGKGSKSEKDALSLGTALKSLAWQISDTDAVYRKELYAVIDRIVDAQLSELWDVLFAHSYRAEATYFLIFDGIDQMEEKHLKILTQVLKRVSSLSRHVGDKNHLCLRILLSGRNKLIDSLTHGSKASIIDLASNNQEDIEMFVRSGIADVKILSGSSPADQTRRDEIFTALTKNAKGDFISIELLLKQIAEKRRVAEMLLVLQQFQGENRTDTIARTIEGLNKTLSKQDILDLNEMLIWLISSQSRMTVVELDAILRKSNGEADYSLQPLAEAIKERYSKILTVEPEVDVVTNAPAVYRFVDIVSDSIREYLVAMNADDEDDTSDGHPRTVKDVDIHESEVKIVKRFLESVCDPDLYQKFQFEQFFLAKLSTSTAFIQFDVQSSHMRISKTCIDAIVNPDAIWAPLDGYFIGWWHTHLEQIDLSLTLPREKTAIGGELIKLFSDEQAIKKWVTQDRLWNMRQTWLVEEKYPDTVLNWFRDSAVIKGVDAAGKQWAKDLTSNSRPDADLLEHIAKYVASQWLGKSDWYIDSDLILFLHSYVCKLENRRKPKFAKHWKTTHALEKVKLKHIKKMLNWAKERLSIEDLDYEGLRSVARTYRECGKYDQAIGAFKESAMKQKDNWWSQWGLARTYGLKEDWPVAIETTQALVKSITDGNAQADDPKQYLAEIRRLLAMCMKKSGDVDGAIKVYESMLAEAPEDFETTIDYLTSLAERKQYGKIVELMNAMKNKRSVDGLIDISCLTLMFRKEGSWNSFHDLWLRTASAGNILSELQEAYDVAVTESIAIQKLYEQDAWTTTRQEALETSAMMLYYYGAFFQQTRHGSDWNRSAQIQWERLFALDCPSEEYSTRWDRPARTDIAFAYLRSIKDGPIDSEEANEAASKLLALVMKDGEVRSDESLAVCEGLARYYAVIGEKQKALDAVKVFAKLNLGMLDDDDPDNDFQAYAGLADDLMFSGYFQHARAAWSLVTPFPVAVKSADDELDDVSDDGSDVESEDVSSPPKGQDSASKSLLVPTGKEDVKTDKTSSDKDQTVPIEWSDNAGEAATSDEAKPVPLEGPLYNYCDGACETRFKYADTFYYCLDCPDIQWCVDCYPKLRAGTLERPICGADHEMFEVPKYDPKRLEEIGKGNVAVGDRVLGVKEWLNELRALWGIPLVEVVTGTTS